MSCVKIEDEKKNIGFQTVGERLARDCDLDPITHRGDEVS